MKMKRLVSNESGIALIMVLLLLVVVGVLSAGLVQSAFFNLNFSQNEVEETKAFYAADAGIEHLKAMDLKNSDVSEAGTLSNGGDYLVEGSIDYGNEQAAYNVGVVKNNGDGSFEIVSEGFFNGNETRITMDVKPGMGSQDLRFDADKTFIMELMWDEGNINEAIDDAVDISGDDNKGDHQETIDTFKEDYMEFVEVGAIGDSDFGLSWDDVTTSFTGDNVVRPDENGHIGEDVNERIVVIDFSKLDTNEVTFTGSVDIEDSVIFAGGASVEDPATVKFASQPSREIDNSIFFLYGGSVNLDIAGLPGPHSDKWGFPEDIGLLEDIAADGAGASLNNWRIRQAAN